MAAAQPPGPDVHELEHELARSRRGMSDGQVMFDLLFGAVAPPLVLWSDPGLFTAIRGVIDAPAAALPPYWAIVAYVAGVGVACLLLLWVLTGARRPVLGLLCVGPFALGALLSLALGYKLLWPALGFGAHLKGVLALTPWLTAFVLARHALRAVRAAAELSAAAAAVSLIVGTGVLLGVFSFAVKVRHRRARLLTDQLLSRSVEDHTYALSQMRDTGAFDPVEIAGEYTHLGKKDPRRERVALAYEILTGGESIALALRRLGVEQEEPKPPVPAPSTAVAPSTAAPPSTADAPR